MKAYQQRLEKMAHYDTLTGLPNRELLADRLQHALAQSQRRGGALAVAFLDLDGFKAVNDLHGHAVGDALLVGLAKRMKDALREGDTLARMGGDEFVIVMVDLETPLGCEPSLERLLAAASPPFRVGDSTLQVSASIGVTLYPQDALEVGQLLRHADQAMYQAKQSGKNCYQWFDLVQAAALQSQQQLLEDIRRGLARHEFLLYFQPKVNLRTGAVVGFEALLRWQHPTRGLLEPAAFLATVANDPLSLELGEWELHSVLAHMAAWRAQGLNLAVSANVGAFALQRSDFAQRLATLLAAQPEVDPAQLELEIVETHVLADLVQAGERMRACIALGVSFSLDDFGTGYSSMTYLKHLPVAVLKIDQSFVRGMHDASGANDLAIVKSVIGLAAAFGRLVLAEGVETAAHSVLLQQLGCDLAQGYGIARPMPASDLPAWLANFHPNPAWRVAV